MLEIPPGSDFIFQVVVHQPADGTFDVVDTRTNPPTFAANFATQPLAAADAVTRNQALDAI